MTEIIPTNDSDNSNKYQFATFSKEWWNASLTLIILYIVFAIITLNVASVHYGYILLWPPSGIALAICILYGKNLVPATFVGSIFVGLVMGLNVPVVLGNAVAQMLEVYVGTSIFFRITDNKRNIESLKELNGIVASAIVGPIIGAFIGIISFYIFFNLNITAIVSEFGFWILRNSLGILTFTPLIVVWRNIPQAKLMQKKFEDVLLALVLILLIITGIILFANSIGMIGIAIICFLLPYTLFISSRFDFYKLTIVHLIITVILVFSTNLILDAFSQYFTAISEIIFIRIEMLFVLELLIISLYTSVVFSDRRRVIRELKSKEKKFRNIFLESLEAVFLLDGESLQRIEVNNAALALYGYSREEFLSQPEIKISDESVPIQSKLKKGKIGETLQIKNRTHYKKNGDSFSALITSSFIEINNKKVIQVLVKDMVDIWSLEPDLKKEINLERQRVEDVLMEKEKFLKEISAHKNLLEDLHLKIIELNEIERSLKISEQKYRSLIENSMIGIVIHIDGIVAFHNQATMRIMGGSVSDNYVGSKILDFIHPDYKDIVSERISKLLRGNDIESEVVEEKLIRLDGKIIDVALMSKIIPFEDNTAIMVTFLDITKQKEIENEIKIQNEHLAFLTQSLFNAQENERKKIAQDLHDELGHSITGIILNLDELKTNIVTQLDEKMRNILDDTIRLMNETDKQLHELSLNLRPLMLDELGLVPTITWYVRQFKERNNKLTVDVSVNNIEERISPELDINIFRIIQESLTNISKHAHANQVGVSLELVENNVTLSIKDDGSGFDINSVRNKRSQKSGMGIIGMEERTNNLGGTFEIFSEPNKGCHLLFNFPHSKSKIASIKSNDVDAG